MPKEFVKPRRLELNKEGEAGPESQEITRPSEDPSQKKWQTQSFSDNRSCQGISWEDVRLKRKWKHRNEPWLPKIVEKMPLPDKLCLEVGCGTGLETSLLAARARKVVAMDLSRGSLCQADQNLTAFGLREKVILIQADAERLPFRTSAVPVVFSNGVLHHTPRTEQTIEELGRVVQSGGQAVVMLYKKYNPLQMMIALLRGTAKGLGRLTGRPTFLIDTVYRLFGLNDQNKNPQQGTGVQELFNCPILKTYTTGQCRRMFSSFDRLRFRAYHNGFAYLSYFLPSFLGRAREPFIRLGLILDRVGERWLGFYLFIFAEKDTL